jgi:hypothetical protein
MSSEIDIPRLRELLAKATQGPWEQGTGERCGEVWSSRTMRSVAVVIHAFDNSVDARLIAEGINALPALLDEVERLRRVEAAAREVVAARYPDEEHDAREALKAALKGGGR